MEIRRVILRKLFRHRYIGGRHTEIRNAMKGFPTHMLKEVKREIVTLIKSGHLLSKPSTGEIHISLNPRKLDEIMDMIVDK
jgi:ABC-type Na+ transport system ATPase subunit NatA|tara:strand:- start:162 stop:404 length:243 start_codon:yes stop_codon:yes gene_type:complete